MVCCACCLRVDRSSITRHTTLILIIIGFCIAAISLRLLVRDDARGLTGNEYGSRTMPWMVTMRLCNFGEICLLCFDGSSTIVQGTVLWQSLNCHWEIYIILLRLLIDSIIRFRLEGNLLLYTMARALGRHDVIISMQEAYVFPDVNCILQLMSSIHNGCYNHDSWQLQIYKDGKEDSTNMQDIPPSSRNPN